MMNFSRTQCMTEEDVEHCLFAEDLTNYVFRQHAGFPVNPVRGTCRNVVRVGFTDTVKKAMGFIERLIARGIEQSYSVTLSTSDPIWTFKNCISNSCEGALKRGFNSYMLLHHCVFVVNIGERLYRDGNKHFHYLSVVAVRDALKMYHMYYDGWGALESASDTIITVFEERTENRSVNWPQEQPSRVQPHDFQWYFDILLGAEFQSDAMDESAYSIRSLQNGGTNSSGTSRESQRSSSYVVALAAKPTQSNTVSSSIGMKKICTTCFSFARAYKEYSTDLQPPARNDYSNIHSRESSYSRSNRESRLQVPESSPDCSTVPGKRRKSSKRIRQNATGENSTDLPSPTRSNYSNIHSGESSYSRSNRESGLQVPESIPHCSTVPGKRRKTSKTTRKTATGKNSTDLPPPRRDDSSNANTGESSVSRSNRESGLQVPESIPHCSTVPGKRRKSSKTTRKNATGKISTDLPPPRRDDSSNANTGESSVSRSNRESELQVPESIPDRSTVAGKRRKRTRKNVTGVEHSSQVESATQDESRIAQDMLHGEQPLQQNSQSKRFEPVH